ncbi:MAG: L,D-transpeptidase family protein [Patescibacteria group bacterium]|jgi:lipoprotein-anchoring transpeptidase ErfK/SrfK
MHLRSIHYLGVLAIALGVFCFGQISQAAAKVVSGVYDQNGKIIRTLPKIPAGASVVIADATLDGTPEIIIGSPAGVRPSFSLLRLDGSVITTKYLENVKGLPAVRVALGDLNADGRPEVVVAFGQGTTPEIRVYSTDGIRRAAFLAFDKAFRGGVSVTVGDIDADGRAEIIAAPGKGGGPQVVLFRGNGTRVHQFFAYPQAFRKGLNVSVADVDGDQAAEIIAVSADTNALVKIFQPTGEVFQSFTSAGTPSAVRVATAGAVPEILIGTTTGKEGRVISYQVDGARGGVNFVPFGKNATYGLNVASVNVDADAENEVLVVPGAAPTSAPASPTGKAIRIDISEQKMYRYQDGQLIATHVISSGKWSMPTPIGTFQIHNKIPTAYSSRYALYMDNWMAITADGAYGIHSLPYWRLKNGGVYYEGTSHLGTRVSHGCVRLSPKESAEVFKWMTVGSTVVVQE